MTYETRVCVNECVSGTHDIAYHDTTTQVLMRKRQHLFNPEHIPGATILTETDQSGLVCQS